MKVLIKSLAYFLCVCLVLTLIPTSVFAQTEDIVILGKDYTTVNVDKPSIYGTGINIIYTVRPEYTVEVSEAGLYEVIVNTSVNMNFSQPATLYVNGNALESVTYYTGGENVSNSFYNSLDFGAGIAVLNEGENSFYLKFDKNLGTNSSLWIKSFTFKKIEATKISSFKIGDKEYEENVTYPKGTDYFTAEFEREIDEESLTNILVKDENEQIVTTSVSLLDDKKTVKIFLKEVLWYDGEYTVCFYGVKDAMGADVEQKEYTFKTVLDAASDSGADSITVLEATVDEGIVKANGVVKNSQNIVVLGKKVELYVKMPNGEEINVANAVSTQDGLFSLEGNIETTLGGNYIVKVKTEYGAFDEKIVFFIPNAVITPILENIKNSKSADEVENILESSENQLVLGINPTEEMQGIVKSKVYERLVGIEAQNASEFKKYYLSAVAIEKINQAKTFDDVLLVLENEDYANALSLNYENFNILENEYKNELAKEVFSSINFPLIEDFLKVFNNVFNTVLGKQLNIENVNLADLKNEATIGEKINFSIVPEFQIQKVKKAELCVEFSDRISDYILDCDWENTDNIFKNTEEYDVLQSVDVLSEISFAVNKTGTASMLVYGKITFETDLGVDVTVDINEKVYSIEIKPEVGEISDVVVYGKDYKSINIEKPSIYGNGLNLIYVINANYEVEIKEAGIYEIIVRASVNKDYAQPASVYVNGKKLDSITYYTGGEGVQNSFNNTLSFEAGAAEFSEGKNSIYIRFDENLGSDSALLLQSFTLKKAGLTEFKELKIGEKKHNEWETFPRGTDVLKGIYSGKIDSESLEDIKITDKTGKVVNSKVYLSQNGKEINIALKEVFSYNTEYTVSFKNVKDIFGNSLEDENFIFKTTFDESDDSGNDFAEITDFVISEGVVTVKGKVLGSEQVEISGKKVSVLIMSPDGVVLAEIKTTSVENGEFSVLYTLENEIAGSYTAKAVTEYDGISDEKEFFYVPPYVAKGIWDGIKKSKNADEVLDILSSNQQNLGIDLAKDTEGMEDVRKVYEHLVGAEISNLDEFKKHYTASLVTEKINQASMEEKTAIVELLSDDLSMSALDIDKTMFDLISDKALLAEKIIESERAKTKEEAAKIIENAFNEVLKNQFELKNITLKDSSVSGYLGQELTIVLKTEELCEKIKSLELEVDLNGNSDKIMDFDAVCEIGNVTVTKTQEGYSIKISDVDDTKTFDEIAKLKIGTKNVCDVDFYLEGMAFCSTGTEVDVWCEISKATCSVKVLSKPSSNTSHKGSGGSSSAGSSSSGKGSGIGSSSSFKPIVSENDENKTQTQIRDYIDLGDAPWAENAVRILHKRRILTLPEDNRFEPNRNITRAEFVKMVVLAFDLVRDSTGIRVPDFKDVSKEAWYCDYVSAAYNKNVVKGDENGCFRPNDYITREDMCVMLSRVVKMETQSEFELFADDKDISDYAKDAVYYAKNTGVINGVGENIFAPKANATRAQAAKILCKMLGEDA